MSSYKPNPQLDLVLERVVDVPPEKLWTAWTTPEELLPWFCPQPWKTVACEIDLRPGGIFKTVLRSPEGQEFPNAGCFLEIVPQRKLVWTDALSENYRPGVNTQAPFHMTAILQFEPHGSGTKYTAIAVHQNEESRKKHEQMGFHEGWGVCLDQLVAYIKSK